MCNTVHLCCTRHPCGVVVTCLQELRKLWDKVKNLCRDGVLDDSFFVGNWARNGMNYRLLIEPVDIANFYFRGNHNTPYGIAPPGHYIDALPMS